MKAPGQKKSTGGRKRRGPIRPAGPAQAFISYSWQDEDIARKISVGLRKAGLRVWFSADAVLPGDDLFTETADALDRSDAMVVILSEESLGSPWMRYETSVGMTNGRFAKRVVPVILPPMRLQDIPWPLSMVQGLSAKRSDVNSAARSIVRMLSEPQVRA